MAITHIQYNPGTTGGSRIRQINQQLESAKVLLDQELATIVTLCEGSDPGQVANFSGTIVGYYGYGGADSAAQSAMAKASYDELHSLQITLNVASAAAITQCANKHR